MRHLFFLVLFIVATATPVIADKRSDIKEFNTAYRAYKVAIGKGWAHKAIPHAKKAYELAGKVKSKDSEFYAKVTYNYADLIVKRARTNKHAKKVAQKAHRLYANLYGEESKEVIDTFLLMAKANHNHLDISKAKHFYREAANLTEKHWGQHSKQAGLIYYKTGSTLLNISSSSLSLRYLRKAKSIFEYNGAQTDIAKTNFLIGKYNLAGQKNSSAVKYLKESLATFMALNPNDHMTLINHELLVEAYEKMGKSDEATKHCQAIGKMRPNNANKDWVPVYKHIAEYPRGAARINKQGYVTLSISIDESGFTKDPKYIDGDKAFLDSALKAVSKFRYAPAFKDGKAVTTEDIKYKFNFILIRRYPPQKKTSPIAQRKASMMR